MSLGHLVGVLKLRRDGRGRRYVMLPRPFGDVRLRDGETLTPGKLQRLNKAIVHFEEHPIDGRPALDAKNR